MIHVNVSGIGGQGGTVAVQDVVPQAELPSREEWLQKAANLWRGRFLRAGYDVPEFHVSVSFPLKAKKTTRGQCWKSTASEDGKCHVLLRPSLSDGVTTFLVLGHEMIHVLLDCEDGHGGRFIETARAVGLLKPWTTATPGPELQEWAEAQLTALPPYAAVFARFREEILGDPTKQPTGTRRSSNNADLYECPETGYRARVTKKWADQYGAPICPSCMERMEPK